jgi:hypothetical protein
VEEALLRASEATEIASYDEFDRKWYLRWRDCHPCLVFAVEDYFFESPLVSEEVQSTYLALKSHQDADKFSAVPPRNIIEARNRAKEIVGISGFHPPSGVVTLQWRDCDPRLGYALTKIFLGHQGVLPPNMKRSAISILKQLKALYDRIDAASAATAELVQIAPEHDPALSAIRPVVTDAQGA